MIGTSIPTQWSTMATEPTRVRQSGDPTFTPASFLTVKSNVRTMCACTP